MHQHNSFGQPVGQALPDWQPRPFPQRQILQGRYCRLEPLTPLTPARSLPHISWPRIPGAGRGYCANRTAA
jgi:hypothetical protein